MHSFMRVYWAKKTLENPALAMWLHVVLLPVCDVQRGIGSRKRQVCMACGGT